MTFLQAWRSFSKPAAVSCDEGAAYVVKGLQHGRADMAKPLTTEQIVAAAGRLVGAPVVETVLVGRRERSSGHELHVRLVPEAQLDAWAGEMAGLVPLHH